MDYNNDIHPTNSDGTPSVDKNNNPVGPFFGNPPTLPNTDVRYQSLPIGSNTNNRGTYLGNLLAQALQVQCQPPAAPPVEAKATFAQSIQ